MKPRKPDRFERLVEDLEFFRDCGGKDTPLCASADVLDLLRNEHAWMRRMVRQHVKWIDRVRDDLPPDFVDGYMQAGHKFLALLAQRRK